MPDDAFADTDCDGIDGTAASAVFLSPSGSDGAAGTRAAPVRSFAKALELAAAGSKDVYVCNGTYEEEVRMLGSGASVYGGYDCSDGWKRIPERAVVAPTTGVALTVQDLTNPVTFERIAFRAASTEAPGESSIAAVVLGSKLVKLLRVELSAGNAGKGVDGVAVPDPAWQPAQSGANAQNILDATSCSMGSRCGYIPIGTCAMVPAGGKGKPTRCSDGAEIVGGAGGMGTNYKLIQTAAIPGIALGFAGAVGTPSSTLLNGNDGVEPAPGTAASSGFGKISGGRYVPSNSGADGSPGPHGQSGTGGSGATSSCHCADDVCGSSRLKIGGGGGQGGYGGCGGPGGKAGGGGGASIALLSSDSTVELDLCTLITGAGGDAGLPSAGRNGQPGGEGGLGSVETAAVAGGNYGGNGGKGGRGSDGGPGAGGPSIGIAYTGISPTVGNLTFQLGAPGKGAAGIKFDRGADGVQAEVHEAK